MAILKKILIAITIFLMNQIGANATQFNAHQETLDNGLKVVIIRTKSNGAIRFGVLYDVGCADDQNCKVGLSHFLEHMMFKGTKTISGEQLKRLIDKYNAYTNACTDDDYTLYHHALNKQFLEIDMKIEADRMVNLALREEDFKHEKNVILEERHLRCDANPQVRHVYDALPRLLYLHSSYAYNGIGYPHHIQSYTLYALKKHYNKFYTPNNATIVIVGDIDKDEAMAIVRNTFGKIKKTHEIKKTRVIDPEDLNITYTMNRTSDKITGKDLTIVFKISRKNIDTVKKNYIAKMVVECLCGTQRSLMAKKFVEEEHSLHDINGNIMLKQFDKVFLFIEANVPDSLTLKDANQKISSYLSDLVNQEKISTFMTKEIFEAVKKGMMNRILMMSDNIWRMFDYAVDSLVNKYNIDDIGNIYNIVSSITWEEAKNWIIENLQEESRALTVYNHPKGSV